MSPEQTAGRWEVVGPASDIYGQRNRNRLNSHPESGPIGPKQPAPKGVRAMRTLYCMAVLIFIPPAVLANPYIGTVVKVDAGKRYVTVALPGRDTIFAIANDASIQVDGTAGAFEMLALGQEIALSCQPGTYYAVHVVAKARPRLDVHNLDLKQLGPLSPRGGGWVEVLSVADKEVLVKVVEFVPPEKTKPDKKPVNKKPVSKKPVQLESPA